MAAIRLLSMASAASFRDQHLSIDLARPDPAPTLARAVVRLGQTPFYDDSIQRRQRLNDLLCLGLPSLLPWVPPPSQPSFFIG
jgi:hypothetical protein